MVGMRVAVVVLSAYSVVVTAVAALMVVVGKGSWGMELGNGGDDSRTRGHDGSDSSHDTPRASTSTATARGGGQERGDGAMVMAGDGVLAYAVTVPPRSPVYPDAHPGRTPSSRPQASESRALVRMSTSMERCPVCGGSGVVTFERKFLHRDHPCPKCLGRGLV